MKAFVIAAAISAGLVLPTLADPVKGEVKKIDEAAGKITLKHERIKNLDMDTMTMVFRVASSDMLKAVKPGDKVTFEADRVNGALTVTKIEKDS